MCKFKIESLNYENIKFEDIHLYVIKNLIKVQKNDCKFGLLTPLIAIYAYS